MINGKDWKFTKFLDDIDDVEAKQIVIKEVLQCMNKLNLGTMNDAEINMFLISCGFTRGCKWMEDKLTERLKDNNLLLKRILYEIDKTEFFVNSSGDFENIINEIRNYLWQYLPRFPEDFL